MRSRTGRYECRHPSWPLPRGQDGGGLIPAGRGFLAERIDPPLILVKGVLVAAGTAVMFPWYGIFPDPSGRYLLAGINGKLGWISGGRLIPLQAEPQLSWIAW
jgi:hypothetical protein